MGSAQKNETSNRVVGTGSKSYNSSDGDNYENNNYQFSDNEEDF